jgi:hypothetical protein
MRPALAALMLGLLTGCGRRTAGVEQAQDASPPLAAPVAATPTADVALDMLAATPRCRIEHRGAFIDVGTAEAAWSTPGDPDLSGLPAFERDGATWGRVLDRSQSFTFALDDAGAALVSMRARARGSKKVTVSVDGKPVGALTLSQSEDKVVTVTNASQALSPGLHVLSLRWHGPAKREEPLAEIDWIRVGAADPEASAFAAPVRRDAVTQVSIGGAPRRAFTLMAPAIVRCVAYVPKGASFAADVGAIGEGSGGEVEVRLRASSGDAPKVIVRSVASATAWSGVSAPLDVSGEGLAVLEIAVTRAPKQGRVAIAEPRVVRAERAGPREKPKPPEAVVVLVFAGLRPPHLALPSLQRLAKEGVTFRGHRAPSQVAAASVASLVTGLPVPVHALEDGAARLSPRTPLVGRALVPFGVQSAMFTEAPSTGPAFGFAHDWTNYAARSPLDGPSAAFDEVGRWLEAHAGKRSLIVAHARGAHPPWDVTADALKTLPPDGYSGSVDPKHVVAILAKARKNLLRITESDRIRMLALQASALEFQDQRLELLLEALRNSGALDKTLFAVTGDAPFVLPPAWTPPQPAGSGSAAPPKNLEPPEDLLALPLVVRFPGGVGAGRSVHAVTDPTDLTSTVVAAFGGPTDGLAGRDLAGLALDDEVARDAPRLSDDGRGYQLAWGDLRLVGAWGKAPRLEARTGGEDLKAKRPYEYLAAWGLAAEARAAWLTARAKGPGREPATIDPQTQAALDSWERTR